MHAAVDAISSDQVPSLPAVVDPQETPPIEASIASPAVNVPTNVAGAMVASVPSMPRMLSGPSPDDHVSVACMAKPLREKVTVSPVLGLHGAVDGIWRIHSPRLLAVAEPQEMPSISASTVSPAAKPVSGVP